MSIRDTSTTIDFVPQRFAKRKLDEYGPLDEDLSDLIVLRTKREASGAMNSFSLWQNESDAEDDEETRFFGNGSGAGCSSSSKGDGREVGIVRKSLHFFVRLMSGGKTIVIHANSDDLVESVHEQIRKMTGIPIMEQRLIYRGKQLELEHTLEQSEIENDAGLQLVGRMRSTDHPKTWQCVNDLLFSICCLCKAESVRYLKLVRYRVKEFLRMSQKNEVDRVPGHFQIFKSAGVPTALVMLLLSPIKGNKECAEESIKCLLSPHIETLPKSIQFHCAPIVLEFCKLLRGISGDDSLYILCRRTLGTLMGSIPFAHGSRYFDYAKPSIVIKELMPFVGELATRLSLKMESSVDSLVCVCESLESDAREFSAFVLPLCRAIKEQVGGDCYLHNKHPCYRGEIETLHAIYLALLAKVDECLKKVEAILVPKSSLDESEGSRFVLFIPVLKELNSISKIFPGAKERLDSVMRSRQHPINALIKFLRPSDDYQWLAEYKDVMDYESRKHLVMMLFSETKDDYEDLHEMLIDRSQLLEESFEYVVHATPESLRGGLFMEFKNEEATGPGVLREWFYMVCKAIFNPQNPLFLSCPNDRRRFYPNPASKVDALHLDYFGFCGRVIALALMHKMQVGVVFDRVFFLQLAGKLVSLEDVRDADPCFYMSCKRILDLDAEFMDSDALGLTFVREIEELGSRKVVELRPGGKDIIVNSKNREEYVNLLIHHRFVKSTSQQVSRFAQGFADILCNSSLREFFFRILELQDFDRMLHGSDGAISLHDWKAHTDYTGYKEMDSQISWFWKVVEGMAKEEQRVLLFFWTSIRYLPVEGFRGLASRLHIYKATDSPDRLPSSHTCFQRLCLPAYPSLSVMRARLQIITQEHVSCSFGNW